jgi:hypothetical protein
VSPLRVIQAYILAAVGVLLGIPFGISEISNGRMLFGTAILGTAALMIVSGILWRRETGTVALTLTSEGISEHGRLIPWDTIADVEADRGGELRKPSIVLILESGETVSIVDDYFDHSIDELCFQIRKRIETRKRSQERAV